MVGICICSLHDKAALSGQDNGNAARPAAKVFNLKNYTAETTPMRCFPNRLVRVSMQLKSSIVLSATSMTAIP